MSCRHMRRREACDMSKYIFFCLVWRIPVRAKIISFILLQCDHYAPVMTVHSGTKRTATHHRPFLASAQLQQWVCDTPPHEVLSSMR